MAETFNPCWIPEDIPDELANSGCFQLTNECKWRRKPVIKFPFAMHRCENPDRVDFLNYDDNPGIPRITDVYLDEYGEESDGEYEVPELEITMYDNLSPFRTFCHAVVQFLGGNTSGEIIEGDYRVQK